MQNTTLARMLEIVNTNYSVGITNPGLQAGVMHTAQIHAGFSP